jgi:hypothetical protein
VVVNGMECEVDRKLPFLGMEAIRYDDHLEMKVYVNQPTLVSFYTTRVTWIEDTNVHL